MSTDHWRPGGTMSTDLTDTECRERAEKLAGKAAVRGFLATTPRRTTDRQLLELAEYADERGYALHSNQNRYDCATILENPRHICTSRKCPVHIEDIDHPVVLRRKDRKGWAILSQQYSTPQGDAEPVLAPYGNGTFARLIVGKVSD